MTEFSCPAISCFSFQFLFFYQSLSLSLILATQALTVLQEYGMLQKEDATVSQ